MFCLRPDTQVQFFHRGDARTCITEQLCYSCRVNMKDLVSDCPSVPVTYPHGPMASQTPSLVAIPGPIATLCPG